MPIGTPPISKFVLFLHDNCRSDSERFILNNNEILRTLRYALKVNNNSIAKIFKVGGLPCTDQECFDMMRDLDDPEILDLGNYGLDCFLNGLIIYKRGPKEPSGDTSAQSESAAPVRITNNVVLKKLRVAFELKDVDLHAIFDSVNFSINKPELSALMRSYGHKNYKLCGDQVLRYFLKGLVLREHGKTRGLEAPEQE